jgi:hypothetical protein
MTAATMIKKMRLVGWNCARTGCGGELRRICLVYGSSVRWEKLDLQQPRNDSKKYTAGSILKPKRLEPEWIRKPTKPISPKKT